MMTFRAMFIFLLASIMNSSSREKKQDKAAKPEGWQEEGFIFLSLDQSCEKKKIIILIIMVLAFLQQNAQ